MIEQTLKPATLTNEELAKLQKLEAEIGDNVVVIAYALPHEPANLDSEKLVKLQQLEDDLRHVYLVAWKKPK